MKCPKFHAACLSEGHQWNEGEDDCLKEECAWWDRGQERCAILLLGQETYWLKEQIIQIRDKMPHAGQFVK